MEVYRQSHDRASELSLAQTVVEAVAAASGVDPTEMATLHDVVDPDALEKLFQPAGGSERAQGRVSFAYEDHQVVVDADGVVEVHETSPAGVAEVADEAAFEAELERLVRTAEANGVDVGGGWDCRDDSDRRDWGIEVHEVAPSKD